MGLHFTILASGSTGNAMVVSDGDIHLLVDAGLSMKKLELLMKQQDFEAKRLNGILVTHEHSDHIKAIGPLSRKYELPVYANEKTWQAMQKNVGEIKADHQRTMATGERLTFGSLEVESFPISHDAADPVGYCFASKDMKLSIATDLGYVSPKVKEMITDSDVLVLESNHDVEMLRVGHYPWNIKRRIMSDTGHLSNEAAGEALCDILTRRTKRVYLAHLSKDHNMMDLAKLTVNNVLEERNAYRHNPRLQIMNTYEDRSTKWDDLSRD